MIVIGSDHGDALSLKMEIAQHLLEKGYEVKDVGCFEDASCDYPVFAQEAAQLVAQGACERGILICSTGIGISIAANKVRGIRCALCHDVFSAKMTRLHNDSNMLALGAKVVGKGLALEIIDAWLAGGFDGGERHCRRVGQIARIEDGEDITGGI